MEVLQGRRKAVDRGGEVGRLGSKGAGEGVEVDDQALQVLLVLGQGAEGTGRTGNQLREVVGLGAEQGVGHLGAVAAGVPAVAEAAVERFGSGLTLDLRLLSFVFGRRRLVGEGGAVALEQVAEVSADRRLQGGEDFVDLDPSRGVADRDRVAAAEFGRARTAG